MKTIAVGELKTQFSTILDEVRTGGRVSISYGRSKKPVAMIVPYEEPKPPKRKLGILDGKAKIVFKNDWAMTSEELLASQ